MIQWDEPHRGDGAAIGGPGEVAPRRVIDAFLAGDGVALRELVPEDVTFHSPVTDYAGRERAATVLAAVTEVVRTPRAISMLDAPGESVAFFTADIEDQRIEGVLRVAGSDITLMIRPLKALLRGVERIKQLL
jgi:hypothetical protein